MQAFHNDPALKAHYLARVRAHRAADELIHGWYWEEGKGCAIGCTLHSSDHGAYEHDLGIPTILARLEDTIFESLTPPHDQAWPEAFLEAITPGADLSMIWPQFALLLLADTQHGVVHYVDGPKHARQKKAIEAIIQYYEAWVGTGIQPTTPADAATIYAATAAATSAADAATDAAAAAAATATDAAAIYAADAATAADAAAIYTADAAREDAWMWQSQQLLALLRAAPLAPREL